jgi:hypothetical protein
MKEEWDINDWLALEEMEMDLNEMSNLYRGPSIDASYQVSYHLAKQFQRKSSFRNRPIRNKNCPEWKVSDTGSAQCWASSCKLQSWAWTHAVLVIGLYELLGNPTT